jgi:proton-translocating NADH-quinone oxidoreductase chain L
MYLLVLAIPALSAFVTGFFGKLLGKNGVQVINISCMIITFIVSSIIFYEVALLKYTCFIDLGLWFNLGSAKVNFEFLFDTITATMLLAVSLVSLLVHIYSLDYMGEDPHFIRFMTYLTVFTLFMFVLLTSGNFIQFFTGWEGVGLASYLLINFWFTRTQANTSALKALIVNRFGDFALYTAILIIFLTFKTLNFYTIFALNDVFTAVTFDIVGFQINIVELICLFLFIGAVGKSAQVGLHVWLPDAMEGPTPVSALIHAATMVTAGVFLIIRCSPLFEYAPNVLVLVTVTGALTAFFAASVGLVQNDLKKVIAYSTCSQLGYMVFACGSSGYAVGFFHLVNHAFFKSLAFFYVQVQLYIVY